MAFIKLKIKIPLIASIAPTLNYEVGQLSSTPIITSNNQNIDEYVETNKSISKTDWDSRETSWDFEEFPY